VPEVKRVVSVSLGTSKRDKAHEAEILGHQFLIERRGTDGDRTKFRLLMEELDGQVAALGVGGADIWIATSKRRYAFREILGLISGVTKTPVVDGSGLKHTLERETIHRLQRDGIVDFSQEKALLVSAVDRFGMAQALDEQCPDVIFGDLMFGVGLPIPVRRYRMVEFLASVLCPIITKLPIQWFYPTGSKQEERKPSFEKFWADRTFLCGDWHYIRRYAPDDLSGKTVLTQTVRAADIEWLRSTGLRRLITTTPEMGGETFATNVMEGVIVALAGKRPDQMTENDFLDVLKELDWSPSVLELG
jgi:hypothetical protein